MKTYLAIGSLDKFRINLFKGEGVQRVLVSYASLQGKGDDQIRIPFEDVMLDSGAFSAETKVAKVSIEAYSFWLETNLSQHPEIKTYINLDDLSSFDISIKNLLYMESLGLLPMPVYHYGEPEEILDWMCSKYEYVGLGGMAIGTMPNVSLQTFWEQIHQKYPNTKFHIFGVGTLTPFFNYQPYSMDSTSWNVGSRFGDIMGYREGVPFRWGAREMYGFKFFFNTEELFKNNIRATLDWEKLEWLKNVPGRKEWIEDVARNEQLKLV